MVTEPTPQKRFDRYVPVGDDIFPYEREARELAAQHGLPLSKLEKFGRYVHYDAIYVGDGIYVGEGKFPYESPYERERAVYGTKHVD